MSTLVQSLIGGIIKKKQTNMEAVTKLVNKNRDTYTLTEVVTALDATDIVIITAIDRDSKGEIVKDDKSLSKASELVAELIKTGIEKKVLLIEGTLEKRAGTVSDVKLCLAGTGVDKDVIFLSQLALIIKDGKVSIYRCQSLPSGLKIGDVDEPRN